jgi:hypothetical protein
MGRSSSLVIVTVLRPAAIPAAATPPKYPAEPDAIRTHHDSGRWNRDIDAVTDEARRRLKRRTATQRAPRRPAIALRRTRAVYRLARRLKVAAFFVTGRPEGLRDGTLRDLRNSGYRGRYELVMRPNDYDQPSLTPYLTRWP